MKSIASERNQLLANVTDSKPGNAFLTIHQSGFLLSPHVHCVREGSTLLLGSRAFRECGQDVPCGGSQDFETAKEIFLGFELGYFGEIDRGEEILLLSTPDRVWTGVSIQIPAEALRVHISNCA